MSAAGAAGGVEAGPGQKQSVSVKPASDERRAVEKAQAANEIPAAEGADVPDVARDRHLHPQRGGG